MPPLAAPLAMNTPTIAPIGTYEGPCDMGIFINTDVCSKVPIPHARKATCKNPDVSTALIESKPAIISGGTYTSIASTCCKPNKPASAAGTLSFAPINKPLFSSAMNFFFSF